MSSKANTNKKIIDTITKAAGVLLLAAGVFLLAISILLNLLQYSAAVEEIEEYKAILADSENIEGDVPRIEENVKNRALKGNPEDAGQIGVEETLKEDAAKEVQQEEPASEPLYILRIPRINSENLVREGTTKTVLADALGHEPGTALVGEGGNCVIAGHRNYSFGKFFNRLGEVEVGDEIYVDSKEGTYSYRVSEIKVVEPDQVEILDETDEEQLTLYTCTPIYIATHRLVIIAKPV